MANQVRFTIPERAIGKADIEFKVKQGGKLLGTLKISKGNLEWAVPHGRGGDASNYNVKWEDVGGMMKAKSDSYNSQSQPKPRRRRK